MAGCIVMGAQWGDEGKGKTVDLLAGEMDLVVRFQGGANAGHTIVLDGKKFILHMLPAGVFTAGCENVIGNGCVVDPASLVDEIDGLSREGIFVTEKNLFLSKGAHVVTPIHKFLDLKLNKHIGTTGRGIGPCYTDKVQRHGIRMEDFVDGSFMQKYRENDTICRRMASGQGDEEFPDLVDSLAELEQAASRLRPYIRDTVELIGKAVSSGKRVLYEGAQGSLLDIDHGTYPFVTSSNTTIGGAYTGSGVYVHFEKRIAVAKAYSTRVGEGPFPTELSGAAGDRLRRQGQEFGATTGRPRRCGWLDLHLLKRAFILNGFNYLVLTKLDCLSGIDTIKVAVTRDDDGAPVYQELPGWDEDIFGVTEFEKLPDNCRKYVEFMEETLNLSSIWMISTGPDRDHTIVREAL